MGRLSKKMLMMVMQSGLRLPYSIDFSALSDGTLPSVFGGDGWSISSGKAICTPTLLNPEIVVNGGFTSDADWTKQAGWTIAGGVASCNGGSTLLYQNTLDGAGNIGKWFSGTFDVPASTSGKVKLEFSGSEVGADWPAGAETTGTFTSTGKVSAAPLNRPLFRSAALNGSIDNVTVKQISVSTMFATIRTSTPNVIAQTHITRTPGTQSGLVVNLDNTSNPLNYVEVFIDGIGNCILNEVVNGLTTNKIKAAVSYVADATLKIVRAGALCDVYYNDLQVGTQQTLVANYNTRHGLMSSYAGNLFNDYSCVKNP